MHIIFYVDFKNGQAVGPCATGCCELRQVRKEATVSGYFVCRRIT